MDPERPAVVDDVDAARFVLTSQGSDGELTYRAEQNRLVLLHAEVPPALRGKGLAGHLVQAAVDRARRSGETIVPWCGYTRRWLKDHPAETDGVPIDWGLS